MPEQHDHDLPVDLYTWIRVATLDLDEYKRAWVRDEIITRFLGKMEHLTADGASERAAAEAILAVMGDPWQVKQAMRHKDAVPAEIIDRVFRAEPEPPRPATPLDKWLEAATRELCTDARARVRAEIEAHYADARAAALEAERSEEDAAREALASLGLPKAAAKEFCKTYLTEREHEELLGLRKAHCSMTVAVLKLVLGNLCLLIWLCRGPQAKWLDQGGWMLLVSLVIYFLALILPRQGLQHLKACYLLRPESGNFERDYKRALSLATAAFCFMIIIAEIVNGFYEGSSLKSMINITLVLIGLGGIALGWFPRQELAEIHKMRKHLELGIEKEPDSHI